MIDLEEFKKLMPEMRHKDSKELKSKKNIALLSNEEKTLITLIDNLREDSEDYYNCVTREKFEEVLSFQKHNFEVLFVNEGGEVITTGIDNEYFRDKNVVIRTDIDRLKKIIKNYPLLENEKDINVTNWFDFIKPLHRKMYAVKMNNIYKGIGSDDFKKVLNNDVFVKVVSKFYRYDFKYATGTNIHSALEYAMERIPLERDMLVCKQVEMETEYRCFVVNKKIVNMSPYKDYILEDIPKDHIDLVSKTFNLFSYDDFPDNFVIDFYITGNICDIVECNVLSQSGRYAYNNPDEIAKAFRK